MSTKKLAECILWAGLLYFLAEPRAEAYVCLSAGSLIIQMGLSGFLLGAASVRAIFLIRFKACFGQVRLLGRIIQQKWGNARVL